MSHPFNDNPSTSELRTFGLIFGGFFATVFGVVVPLLFTGRWPMWPWIVAVIAVAWALIHAPSILPVYRIWMRFGMVMNYIVTRLILGTVFYGMCMPIGFAMRSAGWDAMKRKDKGETSFRTPSTHRDAKEIERPY